MKKKEMVSYDMFQLVERHFDAKEILDIDKMSILLERFYLATGLPNSIIDIEGNVLFGIGWKSICTDFHRINKETAARCLKSDTALANRLKKREKYAVYTCENGMVDAATPIIINNTHLANLFIGQFFFSKPDRNYFIEQADQFGFDKEKYIGALEDCCVYNEESILRYLDFLSELANVLGEASLIKTKREKLFAEVNIAKNYNRSLIEASLDPLVIISPNGIITDVNEATEKATGFTRVELIGTLFSEYFTDTIKAQEVYQQVFRNGRVIDYELALRHVSGKTIPVLYNAAVYKDEKGKIIGAFAAARDITNTRKVEDELKHLKSNLELIVEQRTLELKNAQLLLKSSLESPKDMIIISIDKNYNYYYFNQAYHDVMEYTYGKDVKISMNLLDAMTSKEDIKKVKKNYEIALRGKSHATIEKYGDVAVSYYETFYNPVLNDKNEVIGATAFARNVTNRITQEEKIKELNNQLEYRVLERTAQLESANKELIFQTGEKADRAAELIIANKELFFQNDEKDKRAAELIIANKELEFQNKEKEKRASELQQSEESMRESETKFRAIFESAPDAILLMDQNIFLDCNQKALELFGCTREQIVGQTPSRFSPKVQPNGRNSLEKTQEENNAAMTGQLQFFEWKHCRYDGTLFDAEIRLSTFTVANKIYAQILVHDITMNKRAEAELKFERDMARLYLNTMGIMLVAIDKHEKVILINREGCEILKLQEKDIIGKNWFDNFLPDSIAKDTRHVFDNIIMGNIKDYECHENPVITGTGEKREILWHASIMYDIDGNVLGVLSSGADITDRKRAEESLRESLQRQKKMLEGSVTAFSTAMEVRDPYTSGHQIRVSKLATAIASRLDLKQQDLETLRISGLLHDIGKMYVPAELLSKPSKLSDLEYSMIKVHSEAGYNILKSIDFEGSVAEIVYQHHEKMDGSGYPRQLKGEQILKEARILCVADVVEAMMSNRPYRTALGIDAALEEIERGAGTIYDSDCVKSCVELFRDEGYEI